MVRTPVAVGPGAAVRVMHVMYSLQPGGMELGVVKVVNGLDPSRVQSTICSTKPGGGLKQLVAPRVAIYELNRRDGNDPGLVWSMYRLFRRERPHIVHTHAWGTLLEGLIAARLARVPAVVHGEHGTLQLKPHQRWLQRRAWSTVDRVLSVSSRLAERMVSETSLNPHQITTIRNGVDLTRFNPMHRAAARASFKLDADAFVVGTVGRLVPVKDHVTLIESFASLGLQNRKALLLLAGDGPLGPSLLERARALGIEGSLRLLGHRRDVNVVLAALDVFVLSSVSEGLSNTILEAMASGLPIVATRVGGADELVTDQTGFLVEPRMPGGIAGALERLLANPTARRTMGEAGRRRVETEFALDTMVKRYEALYLDVVAPESAVAVARGADSSAGTLTQSKRLV